MSDLARWLEHLAPGVGSRAAATLARLPTMPVYTEPPGPLTEDDRRLLGVELSVRAAASRLDRARFMLAVRRDALPAGALSVALAALAPHLNPRPLALAERLRASRPDLDLLVGADLGACTRAKLYVLRPAFREIPDFDDVARGLLTVAGVAPTWTGAMRRLAGRTPAFVALDLLPEGVGAGKLYFAFDHPAEARGLLRALDRPWLVDRLDAVAGSVGDHPTGRLVVTVRGASEATADVTLHAHTRPLPPLTPALHDALTALRADAATLLGRPLAPSYVSWLEGPERAESVYYQLGPAPAP